MNRPPVDPAALSWDLLGTFLAVMRTGSLSGASRTLGVAQPTVRRQIEKLEEILGATLFTRSQTGLAPTDTATATMPYAESMAKVADALVRSVSAPPDAEAGTVRVTCSEVVGAEVLPPVFAVFRRAHPRIQIELSLSNANEDLLRRDADVAVRMAQPTQNALVAKQVGTVKLGVFASEAYLADHPVPRAVADLTRGQALVGKDRDRSFFSALAATGIPLKPKDFALRTDSDAAYLASIRAGVGIGMCQVPLAAGSPPLRRLFPRIAVDLPIWVVTHEDLRSTRRVSLVFEHLAASLAAYARSAK
ncbi:MAG TPA: LysR family transcriptional regulator [Polyangiaceae bacterium]|jgi:DNA-binding transcriptional LysR family regulator|nr:LysR family transcriptional regulator [Polyangiaceae bacterium]